MPVQFTNMQPNWDRRYVHPVVLEKMGILTERKLLRPTVWRVEWENTVQALEGDVRTVLLEDLRVALGPEGIVQPVPTVIIILELETLGAPLDVRRKKAQLPVTVKRALAIEIEASAAVHVDLS